MSWSYSGNPASNTKDMVRFLIGDTITADQLLQDEEITAVLAGEPDVTKSAAICAESISAKYSRLADVAVGKTRISYSQKSEAYSRLSDKLTSEVASSKSLKAVPYAGGISVTDKDAQQLDSDRVDPMFERDMFDYPGTEPTRWGE